MAYRKPHHRLFLGLSALVLFALILYTSNTDDIYSRTPFCEADGTCHEKPQEASPRTIYSAKSQAQYNQWWKAHAKLNQTAEEYAGKLETSQKRPFIFLGDSITESWLGTDGGRPVERAQGVPEVLQQLMTKPPLTSFEDPLILAIGGDQTQHLLYRLQHGQLLPAYAKDPSTIFVVLIGTNNLGAGELPLPSAHGVLAVANYLLEHTQGHVCLLQALPRGDNFRLERICPPRCDKEGKPFASFLPAIQKMKDAVRQQVPQNNRLTLLDCGSQLMKSDTEVDETLMPDLLHPNAAGHKVLGDCIDNAIRTFEKG